jgi:hypothetical protein
MSSNVRSFNLALAKHAEEIPAKRIEQLHRAVGLEALRGVVLMTPVKFGRARGNWQQTTDSPATSTVETTDKSGGSTISAGTQVIATIRPFSISWLTNNLDYISELEKGHSQQAPHGMLAVTVNRLRAWLARQK